MCNDMCECSCVWCCDPTDTSQHRVMMCVGILVCVIITPCVCVVVCVHTVCEITRAHTTTHTHIITPPYVCGCCCVIYYHTV